MPDQAATFERCCGTQPARRHQRRNKQHISHTADDGIAHLDAGVGGHGGEVLQHLAHPQAVAALHEGAGHVAGGAADGRACGRNVTVMLQYGAAFVSLSMKLWAREEAVLLPKAECFSFPIPFQNEMTHDIFGDNMASQRALALTNGSRRLGPHDSGFGGSSPAQQR